MKQIIYIVGAVVIVIALLSFVGLRRRFTPTLKGWAPCLHSSLGFSVRRFLSCSSSLCCSDQPAVPI